MYALSLDQLYLPLYESHINLCAGMKMAGLILWPFSLNINLLLIKSCEERSKHSKFLIQNILICSFPNYSLWMCACFVSHVYQCNTQMYVQTCLSFDWTFKFKFLLGIFISIQYEHSQEREFFLMNKLSQWMYIYMYYGIIIKEYI